MEPMNMKEAQPTFDEEVHVVFEGLDGDLLSVEEHLDALGGGGHVVGPPREQRHRVLVQRIHAELGQVGVEGDAREVVSGLVLDLGVVRLAHVVVPRLLEVPLLVLAGSLNRELCGENVAQLGAIAVPTSGDLGG